MSIFVIMNDRIEFLQFDTCIGSSETPIASGPILVSLSFPRQRLTCQKFSSGDKPIQTLVAKNAQLDLSFIEPTAMIGCEVKLQSIQDTAGFGWLKGFIQAAGAWVFKLSSTNTQRSAFGKC